MNVRNFSGIRERNTMTTMGGKVVADFSRELSTDEALAAGYSLAGSGPSLEDQIRVNIQPPAPIVSPKYNIDNTPGEYRGIVDGIASKYGIDPSLLAGMVATESSFNPVAKNKSSGATGLMQLTEIAVKEVAPDRVGAFRRGEITPEENLDIGARYLSKLKSRFGDEAQAVAAYNMGPTALSRLVKAHGDEWLSHAPEETKGYVRSVLDITDPGEHRRDVALSPSDEAYIAAREVNPIVRGLAQGALDVANIPLAAMSAFGNDWATKSIIDNVSTQNTLRVGDEVTKEINGDLLKTITNGEFLSQNLAAMAPNIAAIALGNVAAGGLKAVASSVSSTAAKALVKGAVADMVASGVAKGATQAALVSALEGSSTYSELIANGHSREEALEGAGTVAIIAALLNAAVGGTVGAIGTKSTVQAVGVGMLGEGIEEAGTTAASIGVSKGLGEYVEDEGYLITTAGILGMLGGAVGEAPGHLLAYNGKKAPVQVERIETDTAAIAEKYDEEDPVQTVSDIRSRAGFINTTDIKNALSAYDPETGTITGDADPRLSDLTPDEISLLYDATVTNPSVGELAENEAIFEQVVKPRLEMANRIRAMVEIYGEGAVTSPTPHQYFINRAGEFELASRTSKVASSLPKDVTLGADAIRSTLSDLDGKYHTLKAALSGGIPGVTVKFAKDVASAISAIEARYKQLGTTPPTIAPDKTMSPADFVVAVTSTEAMFGNGTFKQSAELRMKVEQLAIERDVEYEELAKLEEYRGDPTIDAMIGKVENQISTIESKIARIGDVSSIDKIVAPVEVSPVKKSAADIAIEAAKERRNASDAAKQTRIADIQTLLTKGKITASQAERLIAEVTGDVDEVETVSDLTPEQIAILRDARAKATPDDIYELEVAQIDNTPDSEIARYIGGSDVSPRRISKAREDLKSEAAKRRDDILSGINKPKDNPTARRLAMMVAESRNADLLKSNDAEVARVRRMNVPPQEPLALTIEKELIREPNTQSDLYREDDVRTMMNKVPAATMAEALKTTPTVIEKVRAAIESDTVDALPTGAMKIAQAMKEVERILATPNETPSPVRDKAVDAFVKKLLEAIKKVNTKTPPSPKGDKPTKKKEEPTQDKAEPAPPNVKQESTPAKEEPTQEKAEPAPKKKPESAQTKTEPSPKKTEPVLKDVKPEKEELPLPEKKEEVTPETKEPTPLVEEQKQVEETPVQEEKPKTRPVALPDVFDRGTIIEFMRTHRSDEKTMNRLTRAALKSVNPDTGSKWTANDLVEISLLVATGEPTADTKPDIKVMTASMVTNLKSPKIEAIKKIFTGPTAKDMRFAVVYTSEDGGFVSFRPSVDNLIAVASTQGNAKDLRFAWKSRSEKISLEEFTDLHRELVSSGATPEIVGVSILGARGVADIRGEIGNIVSEAFNNDRYIPIDKFDAVVASAVEDVNGQIDKANETSDKYIIGYKKLGHISPDDAIDFIGAARIPKSIESDVEAMNELARIAKKRDARYEKRDIESVSREYIADKMITDDIIADVMKEDAPAFTEQQMEDLRSLAISISNREPGTFAVKDATKVASRIQGNSAVDVDKLKGKTDILNEAEGEEGTTTEVEQMMLFDAMDYNLDDKDFEIPDDAGGADMFDSYDDGTDYGDSFGMDDDFSYRRVFASAGGEKPREVNIRNIFAKLRYDLALDGDVEFTVDDDVDIAGTPVNLREQRAAGLTAYLGDGKWQIVVRPDISGQAQLRTMFHELGHVMFGKLAFNDTIRPKIDALFQEEIAAGTPEILNLARAYNALDGAMDVVATQQLFEEYTAELLSRIGDRVYEDGKFNPDAFRSEPNSLLARAYKLIRHFIHKIISRFSSMKNRTPGIEERRQALANEMMDALLSSPGGANVVQQPKTRFRLDEITEEQARVRHVAESELTDAEKEGRKKRAEYAKAVREYSQYVGSEAAASAKKTIAKTLGILPKKFQTDANGIVNANANTAFKRGGVGKLLSAITDGLKTIDASVTNAEYLLEGLGVEEGHPLHDVFVKAPHEARVEYLKLQDRISERMNDVIKKNKMVIEEHLRGSDGLILFEDGKPEKNRVKYIPTKINGNRVNLTTLERAALVLHSEHPTNRKAITSDGFYVGKLDAPMVMTDADIATLTASLSREELDIVRAVRDVFAEHGAVLQDAARRAGKNIDLIDAYFPIMRAKADIEGKTGTDGNFLDFEAFNKFTEHLSGTPGSMKERTGSNAPIMLEDAMSAVFRTTELVNRYSAFLIPVMQMRDSLSGLAAFMKNNGMEPTYKALANMVDRVQGRFENNTVRFIQSMNSRFATGVLGFKVATIAKQATAIFSIASELGATPFEFVDTIKKMVPSVAGGWVMSDEAKRITAEIAEHDRWLLERRHGMVDRDIAELHSSADVRSKLGTKASMSGLGMRGIVHADWANIIATWKIAKQKVEHDFGIKEGTPEYWDKVRSVADKAIRRTQPGYGQEDQSLLYQEPVAKPFTMFGSAANKTYMQLRHAAIGFTRAVKKKDTASMMKHLTVLIGAGFGMALASSLIDELWRNARGEKREGAIVDEMMRNLAGVVFMGGNLYDLASAKGLFGESRRAFTGGAPTIPLWRTMDSFLTGVSELKDGDLEPGFKKLIDSYSQTTGIGVSGIMQFFQTVKSLTMQFLG